MWTNIFPTKFSMIRYCCKRIQVTDFYKWLFFCRALIDTKARVFVCGVNQEFLCSKVVSLTTKKILNNDKHTKTKYRNWTTKINILLQHKTRNAPQATLWWAPRDPQMFIDLFKHSNESIVITGAAGGNMKFCKIHRKTPMPKSLFWWSCRF